MESYFDSHCLSEEEYFSLSSTAALLTFRALNAAKFFISFGSVKRRPQAWWSPVAGEAGSERRTAFGAAHRSNEDRLAYISANQHALFVIVKAKPESWQATYSSLSPKSNLKFVYSLFFVFSLTLLPHLPPLLTYPTVPLQGSQLRSLQTPLDLTFVFQPKVLRSRARGCLYELRRATCPEESHSVSASLFLQLNFSRLPQTSPRPLPLARKKLSMPC